MNLPLTSKENYNNNTTAATKDMTFGVNDVNSETNIVGFVPMAGSKYKINRMLKQVSSPAVDRVKIDVTPPLIEMHS